MDSHPSRMPGAGGDGPANGESGARDLEGFARSHRSGDEDLGLALDAFELKVVATGAAPDPRDAVDALIAEELFTA